jgi:cyclopropane fatty-acyl-phospholipid synthase-like methyltransferase
MSASTTADADICVICGEPDLTAYVEFPGFLRVTSDCKPFRARGRLSSCTACRGIQKPDEPSWRQDCDEIYANYALYAQSGGVEQQTFGQDQGQMNSRSRAILSHVGDYIPAGEVMKILDYGCGLGAMISALADAYPYQAIDGLDISRRFEAKLSKLPGFSTLYLAQDPPAAKRWDLITMIHCLEHLPDPVTVLRNLAPMLTDQGRLLIQVPNTEANPFDLLVADHRAHFSAVSLRRLLHRAGYRVHLMSTGVVATELTVIASPDDTLVAPDTGEMAPEFARGHLAWLAAFREMLQQSSSSEDVGVFGSSVAANWLIPHAPERVSHVLDEDPNRHGFELFGCPIIAPDQAPTGLEVLLPFAPVIARRIAGRLSELPLRFKYLDEKAL